MRTDERMYRLRTDGRNFTTFCNFVTEVTRNQGALIGRVGSFSELLKFTVLRLIFWPVQRVYVTKSTSLYVF